MNLPSGVVAASDGREEDWSQDRPSSLPFWLAITCLIVVSLNLRPGIVSIGPLLPRVQEQFGFSHTSLSLLVAIPDFLMGALALPGPRLARRFGRDRVILGALVLLFAGIVVRGVAPDPVVLLLATAAIGAGIAITGALIASFVKAQFLARAGLALGVYSACLGGGSTLAAGLTGPVAVWAGNWRLGGLLGASRRPRDRRLDYHRAARAAVGRERSGAVASPFSAEDTDRLVHRAVLRL